MIKTVSPSSLCGLLPVMPSKSASHRAVMLSALSSGETALSPLQLSLDIRATLACSQALGLCAQPRIAPHETEGFVRAVLSGGHCAGTSPLRTLDCGESGSTLRFFIPLALDGRGPVRFVGHGRLMQRPLELYERLFTPQGILWHAEGNTLTVDGKLQSGDYALRGDVSSQFITGLLLALPLLEGESRLFLTTPLQSRAYVDLTRRVQKDFGIVSFWEDDDQMLRIPGHQRPVSPGHAQVESDWSHAAFYLVAGAIGRRGPITLTGLDPNSAQGDQAIVDILRRMGAEIRCDDSGVTVFPSSLHAVDVDASQIPDLVPILAVAMAAAAGESRIYGAARLRIKESDRLRAMHNALSAAGTPIKELPDGLVIQGGRSLHAARIEGCNDHRIVMSMAVASAMSDGPFVLTDAEAPAKSAPAFWQEFASLGGNAQ